MSDPVIIALIVAVVVIVTFIIFHRQLSRFIFRVNRDGIDTELATYPPTPSTDAPPAVTSDESVTTPGVRISGNIQRGRHHRIFTNRAALIRDNRQSGEGNAITVATAPPTSTISTDTSATTSAPSDLLSKPMSLPSPTPSCSPELSPSSPDPRSSPVTPTSSPPDISSATPSLSDTDVP